MEAVLGESLGDGSFQEVLKSGVHLCNLANKIKEGVCTKPSAKKLPFVQMENIGHYLAACTKLGMLGSDSFQTVDLYENKASRVTTASQHRAPLNRNHLRRT